MHMVNCSSVLLAFFTNLRIDFPYIAEYKRVFQLLEDNVQAVMQLKMTS